MWDGIRYTEVRNPLRYLRNLFHDILNDYGRVFVVVRYSENTVIGMRGFTEEEKKQGLTLVFSRKNFKDLAWAEDGSLQATLGFGTGNRSERCFLFADDIMSVFSPDAKIKFDRWDVLDQEGFTEKSASAPESGGDSTRNEKVVSLERFRRLKA